MSIPSARTNHRAGYRFLALWLAAGFVLGATEVQGRWVMDLPQTVPLCIWGLTLGALAWHARSPTLRHFTRTHDLRPVILFHAARVPYGIAFLLLGARGALDPAFAGVAGWGDVVAGGLALPAALLASRERRRWVFAWNAFALLDILLVIATAGRIVFSGDATGLRPFADFPFTLLPVLVVPWILLSHLWVLLRLRMPTPLRGTAAPDGATRTTRTA